jgi:hypothetical protein
VLRCIPKDRLDSRGNLDIVPLIVLCRIAVKSSKALERMTVVGDDKTTNDWLMVDPNVQEVDVHGDVQTDQIYDCEKE